MLVLSSVALLHGDICLGSPIGIIETRWSALELRHDLSILSSTTIQSALMPCIVMKQRRDPVTSRLPRGYGIE
jgi:hypothetical protein